MEVKITKLREDVLVIIPNRPNFIKVNDVMQPLNYFSEKELKHIGKLWVNELIKNAHKNTLKGGD